MTSALHTPLCSAEHSQLLIIDIQERLASAMPDKVLDKITHNTGVLIRAARELNIPVIRSEQYPKGLGDTVKAIARELDDKVTRIEKTCFSCFGADGFTELLHAQQKSQIIICGIESHICVLQTALQLHQQGYEVYVVEDGVCSRHKQHHKNALARLRQHGVIISNVESVLFEWLRDASHPAFKTLAKLIK